MIYVVEMDFRNPAREADWHAWYLEHATRLIRDVPGFRATQRFRALTATPSPWLALHDVASPEVFESAAYKAGRRPGIDWGNGRTSTRTGTATSMPASR